MSGLRYGSLFSGYAGLDHGVQSVLGGSTAWFSEFDKHPSAILAHHWPDVPNHGDITRIDFTQVEPVDVLTGGFPCQDVSHAGRRAGLIRDGEGRTRSGLWGEMLRAITELRPRLVVAENVRGLLSAAADSDVEPCPWCLGDANGEPDMRALGAVLADLADVGYDAWWVGLRAADVGAAHGRFRVFIFAVSADSSGDPWGFGDGDHLRAWGRVVGRAPNAGERDPADLTLLPTPVTNDMGEGKTVDHWDSWTATMQAKHGNGNGHGKSLAIEAQRLLPTPVSDNSRGLPQRGTDYASLPNAVCALLPTPSVADVEGGRKHRSGARSDELLLNGIAHHQTWGDYAPAIARWEAVIGRPAPAPTEPGPKGNPRLSAHFVEWLMGLPAGHVTDVDIPRNAQLKSLGNGVVPAHAAAAAQWWLAQMSAEARRTA